MRILIVNWHRQVVGGVEKYLQMLAPALQHRGHEIAFVHGYASDNGAARIDGSGLTTAWCFEQLGLEETMRRISRWAPAVVYLHGCESIDLERAVVERFPAVLFVHTYDRTCPAPHRRVRARPRPRRSSLGRWDR